MKLVFLLGPPAVGKMTVGQELAQQTDLQLFHNHQTNDLVAEYFSYDEQGFKRLVPEFRKRIFEEYAQTDKSGLIFTYCCAFDEQEDKDFLENCTQIFEQSGAAVFYVELRASQEERLRRNTTENRLEHKPSKRDIEQSRNNLLRYDEKYTFESPPGFFESKNHFKIDTTELSVKQTAQRISEWLNS